LFSQAWPGKKSGPGAPGRRRVTLLPRFEALEARCTPTTLPAGFTEATVATGLTGPTAMEFAPDGRLFVLEQAGNVEFVRPDGSTWTALHLNVDSQGERGLLGIAFDPAFASNHFVYLYYTNPGPGGAPWATGEHNQLSRFTVDDSSPNQPIFKNEAPILDWDNLSAAENHNGGAIHFGLDGMLYADAGDNMQTFTQGGNTYRVSQTLSDLLGKQLRIDVGSFNRGVATRDDTIVGHLIPADNPFVGTAAGIDQLIYALGLRNPFTFAVEPGTGTIFINDVGEVTWEEIDQSSPGANFGWLGGNTDGFGHSSPPGPGVYHDPLLAYNHSGGPAGGGTAIVGGAFYDPSTPQFPASYAGKYFYADLSGGWIRVFDPANPGSASNPDTSSLFASGIADTLRDVEVDQAGYLYYLTGSGTVVKVSFQSPGIGAPPVPAPTLAPGLHAEFFDFTARLHAMPNLEGRLADVTRTDLVLDYRPTRRPWAGLDARFANTFAARETGFLLVSTPGRYKLGVRSKDGAKVWLDGALLVKNGGIHPVRTRAKAITLTAGLHALRVESFANTGVAGLILSWSGPGIAKQVVPANHLFHVT
jgi:glucose/arabinose dehydrogenase